jgi:hypothetical protein
VAGEILRALNDLFDCQIKAIDQHGAEMLKDGLLTILLFWEARTEAASCAAALATATPTDSPL